MRLDALLVSINERLAGKPGEDIGPLGDGWERDLWTLAAIEAPPPDPLEALAELEGLPDA